MAQIATEILNLDYTTIYNDIVVQKNTHPSLQNWDITNTNDPLGFVLRYYISSIEKLGKFANNLAQEFTIATALSRDSVLNHAVQLGYSPSNYLNSSGSVILTCTSLHVVTSIPKYSLIVTAKGSDGKNIFFTNPANQSIPMDVTTFSCPVVEGRSQGQSIVSSGEAFQSIILSRRVVESSIQVFVNSVLWSPSVSLFTSGSLDEKYRVRYLDSERLQILFGDNINGKIPPKDAEISIQFIEGGGSRGNVLPGTITSFISNPEPNRIKSVTNSTTFTGGFDAESIERIRNLAIRLPRINNRAVSKTDMKSFCESFDGVARANVIPHINSPIIQIIPEGGGVPSSTLKNNLYAALSTIAITGYKPSILDPVYKSVNLSVTIRIDINADASSISNYALSSLTALLNPLTLDSTNIYLREFGEPLLVSEIYDLLISYPGILSLDITDPVTIGSSDILFSCAENEILTNVGSNLTISVIPTIDSGLLIKSSKSVNINPKYQ